MAGNKGGSSTTSVEVPEYIEAAAQRNLNRADRVSQMGYVPYYGPDVAAFTPMQQAAFQNTADTAGAFGMASPSSQQDIMGGMPAPTEFAGGVRGYSSAPMFEQSQAELARRRPAQKEYIDSFFIDPVGGGGGLGKGGGQVDYTKMETLKDQRDASRAHEAMMASLQNRPSSPDMAIQPDPEIFGNMSPEAQKAALTLGTDPKNPNYNDAFNTVYEEQSRDARSNPTGMSTGFGITTDILDDQGVDAFLPPTSRPSRGFLGGFTSIGDMFDGGGAGKSGDTFEGGGAVSKVANVVATPKPAPKPKPKPKKKKKETAMEKHKRLLAPKTSPRPPARPKKKITSKGGGGK